MFLYVPDFLLRAVVAPIGAIEFGALLIGGFCFGGGCTALWYAGAFCLSDKINLRRVPRAVCVCLLAAAFLAGMLARNLPSDPRITLHGYYGTNVAIVRGGGQTCVLLSGEADEAYLSRLFVQEGIARADAAVVLAPAREVNTALPVLLRCIDVGVVYVRADSGFVDGFMTVTVREQSGFFTVCGMPAAFAGEVVIENVAVQDNAACGIVVNTSDVTLKNVSTSGNGWGGVNVDHKGTAEQSTSLTVDAACAFGEQVQIYCDGSMDRVTVTAEGYTSAEVEGVTVWTK